MSGIQNLNSSLDNSPIEHSQEEQQAPNSGTSEASGGAPLIPPDGQAPWGDSHAGVESFLAGDSRSSANATGEPSRGDSESSGSKYSQDSLTSGNRSNSQSTGSGYAAGESSGPGSTNSRASGSTYSEGSLIGRYKNNSEAGYTGGESSSPGSTNSESSGSRHLGSDGSSIHFSGGDSDSESGSISSGSKYSQESGRAETTGNRLLDRINRGSGSDDYSSGSSSGDEIRRPANSSSRPDSSGSSIGSLPNPYSRPGSSIGSLPNPHSRPASPDLNKPLPEKPLPSPPASSLNSPRGSAQSSGSSIEGVDDSKTLARLAQQQKDRIDDRQVYRREGSKLNSSQPAPTSAAASGSNRPGVAQRLREGVTPSSVRNNRLQTQAQESRANLIQAGGTQGAGYIASAPPRPEALKKSSKPLPETPPPTPPAKD
jgi:hypothetical protein